MAASPVRTLVVFCALGVSLTGCADRSLVAPTDDAALLKSGPVRSSSNPVERPIKADCTTTFTFIDPGGAGQCAVFQQVPSKETIEHLLRFERDQEMEAAGPQPEVADG